MALSGVAMGVTETFTIKLPESGKATASLAGAAYNDVAHAATDPNMSEFAIADCGLYMFAGKQTDIGSDATEGTWVNTNNTGSITLYGRPGYGGTDMLLVVDGSDALTTGKTLTSLTLNTTATTGNNNLTYGLYLAVVNASDEIVASAMGTSLSNRYAQEVTLSDIEVAWGTDYRLMVGISSNGFGSWNSVATVDGISLKAGVIDTPAIPEPTTATLSLLALAGLAARRRRR